MHVSEIARGTPPPKRRVGITFQDRTWVMEYAIRIYHDLGIDLEIDGHTISIHVPETAARWYTGALERYTGVIGFNEWETR